MKANIPTDISLPKRLLANLRAGDWFVVLLFILLATGSFWGGQVVREQGELDRKLIAVVTVSNRSVAAVNLQKPSEFTVQGALGEVTIRVANHRIRVLRSPCPNQVCVRQGEVHRPGEMLVCAPNQLVVFIRGEADSEFTSTQEDSAATASMEKFAPWPRPGMDNFPVKSRGDAVTY